MENHFFHIYAGIVYHLSGSYVIPEMIVVGIVNTKRNLDLTPTADSTSNNKPNGGGEIFTSLEKELIFEGINHINYENGKSFSSFCLLLYIICKCPIVLNSLLDFCFRSGNKVVQKT